MLFINLKVNPKMNFFSFSQNFELTLEKLSENNPYLLVAIVDFNAKLSYSYSHNTKLLREFQLKIQRLNFDYIK